jgi:Sulfotransferase family
LLAGLDMNPWRMALRGYGYTEEEWLESVRRVVEDLHGRYARIQGKNRWAIKAPQNALILDYINRLYPDCQVIHIVRHPSEVVESNVRMYGLKQGGFYGRKWINHVRTAEGDGSKLGEDRFRTVRYEDLVSEPEETLRELLSWLGEPWREDVLHFEERTHSYPPRKKEPSELALAAPPFSSFGRRGRLNVVKSMIYVRRNANDLLQRFGYEVSLSGLKGALVQLDGIRSRRST